MSVLGRPRFGFATCFLFLIVIAAGLRGQAPAGPDHAIVAGFERFYAAENSDAAAAGQLLLGELNCLSCHTANAIPAGVVSTKKAPILTDLGQRARMDYFLKFLADPHKTKAGTTMPNALAGMTDAEKSATAEALVSFLATTGKFTEESVRAASVRRGDDLFHTLGCVACHGPRKDDSQPVAGTINLGKPSRKYTLSGLTKFLQNPLVVRPSARMPHFNLSAEDARDVASFLLKDLSAPAMLTFDVYEGAFNKLPEFAKLKPVESGAGETIDINVTKRKDNFAIQFGGKIQIETAGDYRFWTTSDDGSRVTIDGRIVVDNDGVHAPSTKEGSVKLTAGLHDLFVDFFEAGGGEELKVEYQAPVGTKQLVDRLLWSPPPKPAVAAPAPFVPELSLVEKGRGLFGSLGCAACHELKSQGQTVASTVLAPTLAMMKPTGGCLSEAPTKGRPEFVLNGRQRMTLSTAIAALQKTVVAPKGQPQIHRTFVAMNCYACHERDGQGGPTDELSGWFRTTQPEMGDEGRLPPRLTGVGAKLRPEYLNKIFAEGARDRPYMFARMPRFGVENVGHLTAVLDQLEALEPLAKPTGELFEKQLKTAGRQMVGDKGYSCVKCHTWDQMPSQGVQSINMTIMHQRLREEWFRRYVIDPPKFRPQTRMPSAWPGGKGLLTNILGGQTDLQVYAVWQFLSDGSKASMPPGLLAGAIELQPTPNEAVLYRNFIEGAGPRAIGVGYPERVNIAFDANSQRLAMIWQNAFIDAKKHWTDRGVGFQGPLGDGVVRFADGPPLAVLADEQAAWPKESAKQLGFQFRGYDLDAILRPTFRYTWQTITAEDFPQGASSDREGSFLRRTVRLTTTEPVSNLFFRASSGLKVLSTSGGDVVLEGGNVNLLLKTTGTAPQVRGDQVLIPVVWNNGKAEIKLEYHWVQ